MVSTLENTDQVLVKNKDNILKLALEGKTLRDICSKYRIKSIHRLSRAGFRLWGLSQTWKSDIRREKREKLVVDVSKELCKLPDLRKVCAKRGISYFGFISNTGFRARAVPCYKKSRNTCWKCGVNITHRSWNRRLCPKHNDEFTDNLRKRVAKAGGWDKLKKKKTHILRYYGKEGGQ